MVERIRARAADVRDAERPLVWFHAPSVGEGLQARPIALTLRQRDPAMQLAYTFFSPSAEAFAKSVGAEISDYLPFDGVREADALLDALKPSALVFVKLDVWPLLVARAAARRVPVALLSATVSPESSRLGTTSRAITRDAYAALSAVGAIDEHHAKRLESLGVRRDIVRVTGDTRFDQVWERAQRVDRDAPLLTVLQSSRPTLVAGSTWPADETHLFAAWSAVRAAAPSARLVIAPHEPTAAHVETIVKWARSQRLRTATLATMLGEEAGAVSASDSATASRATGKDASDPDVIVVDRVGLLGDLYALASVAFVGGGFHSAGLHSVIEPAAFGVPVVFGPGHGMSREAGLLLEAHGARSVSTSAELGIALAAWLRDAERRAVAGEKARAVVEAGRGATERSVELVQELLERS